MTDEAHAVYHKLIVARNEGECDRESAHGDADEALCEALRLAAAGKVTPGQAELLIQTWKDVPKWYA